VGITEEDNVTDAYERHTAQLFDRVLAAKAAPDAAKLDALRAVAEAARAVDLYWRDAEPGQMPDSVRHLLIALANLDRARKPHDPYSHKTGRAII